MRTAVGRSSSHVPSTIAAPARLLCLENTHNIGGGTVWPLPQLRGVCAQARALGLKLHLDGARLWHAAAASGVSEADFAAPFDTVSVCFSKALGAPVGSCLAGSRDLILRARRFKQQIGGGFRQAGIVAAGAVYALDRNRGRLPEVHALATRFAVGLANIGGIVIEPASVETNIVRFRLVAADVDAFLDAAKHAGLLMLPSGPDGVRAVFYLDITAACVDEALGIIGSLLDSAAKRMPRPSVTSGVDTVARS